MEGQAQSAPKTIRTLSKIVCIFSSKSGDSRWNVWWVITRTSKSWHTQIHTHTDTGDDNTRRPKGPWVKMMCNFLTYMLWHYQFTFIYASWKAIPFSLVMNICVSNPSISLIAPGVDQENRVLDHDELIAFINFLIQVQSILLWGIFCYNMLCC